MRTEQRFDSPPMFSNASSVLIMILFCIFAVLLSVSRAYGQLCNCLTFDFAYERTCVDAYALFASESYQKVSKLNGLKTEKQAKQVD